jgi:hypothetical protein
MLQTCKWRLQRPEYLYGLRVSLIAPIWFFEIPQDRASSWRISPQSRCNLETRANRGLRRSGLHHFSNVGSASFLGSKQVPREEVSSLGPAAGDAGRLPLPTSAGLFPARKAAPENQVRRRARKRKTSFAKG